MKTWEAFRGDIAALQTEYNVPMRTLTTFRVGGPADVVIKAPGEADLLQAVDACKRHEVPYYILGNGSNVLVRDEGIRGAVIHIAGGEIKRHGNLFCAQAGVPLSVLAREAAEQGFAGLEWACGIPGTLGGACAMNAGAYGGEMKQVLTTVRLLCTQTGKLLDHTVLEEDLGYRTSAFAAPGQVVISATVALAPDDGGAKERMRDYMARRREKQPVTAYSAGSTFKRPPGHFAGALIEGAGLKGHCVGGAEVSRLHAGFIINRGDATADDILRLIDIVKENVYAAYGVALECELKIW